MAQALDRLKNKTKGNSCLSRRVNMSLCSVKLSRGGGSSMYWNSFAIYPGYSVAKRSRENEMEQPIIMPA